jgi:uncharacterized glyoxalase superfamily protein PhnB
MTQTKIELQSLAPVLVVETIEPCLPFWQERLGFELVSSVPEGDRLGFAMLGKDGVTVMYQSRESVRKDIPALAEETSSVVLYLSVNSLEAVEARLKDLTPVVPKRQTFYGATEIGVREPGGSLVMFAQHAPEG